MSKTGKAGKEWFWYLDEHSFGSSGDGGNLFGMRKKCWGKDALVVRCCGCLFHVDADTFYKVTGRKCVE